MENKRKGSIPKASSTTTEAKPGPVVKDGKPVFETKAATAVTPGLFDSPETAAASGESPQELTTSTAEPSTGVPRVEVAEPVDKWNTAVETAAARLPGL